jgi:amino acid transporter
LLTWRLLGVVVLSLALVAAVEFIVHRSFTHALKAIKTAFKAEFQTDSGRLNLVAMFIMLFVFILTSLGTEISRAVSKVRQPGADLVVPIITLFCILFLLGCVITVSLLERNKSD